MKINTTIGLQIIPISEMRNDLKYSIIDKIIKYLKRSKNVNVHVGPLETTIEGEYNVCMNILYNAIQIAASNDFTIFANLKIIYNPKSILTIDEKITNYK